MQAPALRELQGLFFDSVTTTPGEVAATPCLLALVEPSATLRSEERLRVYAEPFGRQIIVEEQQP